MDGSMSISVLTDVMCANPNRRQSRSCEGEGEVTTAPDAVARTRKANDGDDNDSDGWCANCGSCWQREEDRCAAVLSEVFEWLSAREVCAASGVCRAWRRAAAEPALWRRMLQRDTRTPALSQSHLRTLSQQHVSWREEYVKTFAGWVQCGAVRCSGEGAAGESVVDAVLDPADSTRLALLTDDATLTIWQMSSKPIGWKPTWSYKLRERGWSGAARVLWAGTRLLVAGPLALVDDWGLLVLQIDEDNRGHIASRTRCSAGAAGCWLDDAGAAFLSFQLNVFAPSVACTTVWLNSATQETQSEHTGVRAPLFRIYNETGEHFTMAIVIDTPLSAELLPQNILTGTDHSLDTASDLSYYFKAMSKEVQEEIKMRVLVTTSGCRGGGTVCAWGLSSVRPPEVQAAARGDLRERVRRMAEAAAEDADAPAPPPTAHEVRALCSPPDDACSLPAPPVALTPHARGRCLWVSLSSGEVWCLSSPTLRLLRRLTPADPYQNYLSKYLLYYVRIAVSDDYIVSPMIGGGGVAVWRTVSGGAAPATRLPALAAPATGPALVALLPHTDRDAHVLLIFTNDTMHKIQPQLQRTCSRNTSKSCDGIISGAKPAPCEAQPRPACRPPPPSAARVGDRVACCPPPRGRRPPCPAKPPTPARTCSDVSKAYRETPCDSKASHRRCGHRQDKVAVRLAAAEAARRADYEREVAQHISDDTGATPASPLSLGEERHCCRATDGRMYVLPGPPEPLAACGPGRTPPTPRRVSLQPDDACRVNVDRYLDPCAHRPRTFVEIARSAPETRDQQPNESTCSTKSPTSPSSTSRVPDGMNISRKSTSSICSKPGNSKCPPGARGFHTSPFAFTTVSKAALEGIDNVLRERNTLKEAGRGRVVICNNNNKVTSPPSPPPPGGHLELEVPPGTDRVSVRVTLSSSFAPVVSCSQNIQSVSLSKPCPIAKSPNRNETWRSLQCQQKMVKKNEDKLEKGKRNVPKSPCSNKRPTVPARSPPPPQAPRSPPCPSRPPCPPSSSTRHPKSTSDKKPVCKSTAKIFPLIL